MKSATLRLNPALAWPGMAHSATVLRYMTWLVLVGTCMLFYTWSQVDAQESILALTETAARFEHQRNEHERLLLELEVQRNIATLHQRAPILGITNESPVVEVR